MPVMSCAEDDDFTCSCKILSIESQNVVSTVNGIYFNIPYTLNIPSEKFSNLLINPHIFRTSTKQVLRVLII